MTKRSLSLDGRCGSCVHFRNDPSFLESVFKGLTVMSSGYASVVAEDGVCRRHDRYLGLHASCADWQDRRGPQAA
jgi:hypothetical protein